MIKINLLPQEMTGGKAAGTGSQASGAALVALVLIVLFAVDILLGGFLYYQFSEAKQRQAAVEQKAKDVAAALEEQEAAFQEFEFSIERMERIIEVAESLDPDDRLLWSRKLNMLPLLIPDGVFLTQVAVTQRVTEVETEESLQSRNQWEKTRKGEPPAIIKIPVYTQTLFLDGLAYVEQGTENQRLSQIITFNYNMRDNEVKLPYDEEESRFLEGFMPNIGSSAAEEVTMDSRAVTQFRFTITTKQLKIESKTAEASNQRP